MRIVLIGAGNLATILGKALLRAGHEICQVYSQTDASAALLAESLLAEPVIVPEKLVSDADIYICALKDDALEQVLPHIQFGQGILVHTAGSIPLSALQAYSNRIGVFYPFQTFSKDRAMSYEEVPIYIEAEDVWVKQQLFELAHSLSNNVQEANDEKRLTLHVSAVFACNFVNYMYTVASDLLAQKGLDFSDLLPLIRETARKVETLSPIDAQTGPAVRMDRNSMDKHILYLKDFPELSELYEVVSKGIYERKK